MICPQCESAAQLDYWHVGSYLDRRLVYANALAKFGERGQLVVALEELSECQKEICKILRGGSDYRHLAEEIADAQIMLEQVTMIYDLGDCVENIADRIRAMTDEELAEIIMCPYDNDHNSCVPGSNCLDCCLKWLQQPCEEGTI